MRPILCAIPLALALACSSEQEPSPPPEKAAAPAPATAPQAKTPPYHESEEAAKPFPKLLDPEQFATRPLVARAYRIAAARPGVLAQQPCYCHCDALGHGSLLDCFASDHGAG